MLNRNTALFAAAATLATQLMAHPAVAREITFTPTQDARLRYERVEQDGIDRAADALTLRIRSGITAARGPLSILLEAQGTIALVDRYDDSVGNGTGYPVVGDPQNIALYRVQVQYKTKALILTGGRQKITLDDERFVGAANWRQAARSFDAARLQWAITPTLKADVSYAWSVRTPSGINGRGAKPPSIGGDNVFVNLSQSTPVGTLVAFAYLIDQDEAAVQSFRLSNQTYGTRLAGTHSFNRSLKATWQLSFAQQSDYHRNPNHYRADYYLADAGLDVSAVHLGIGYEVLGADHGTALASFQTPLASIFKFQGWADKLTTTPPNGVRDLYGNLGWSSKTLGPFKTASIQAVYHRYNAERVSIHYGNEFNLLASAKWRNYSLAARYADYHADRFATNTRKLWLELSWTI